MTTDLTLIPIDRGGVPRGIPAPKSEVIEAVLVATVELYESAGFFEPWIGYLASRGSEVVGTCAFKAAPDNGRVEIAYYTFPPHEGQGVATAMASALLAIAAHGDPAAVVTAQTLPSRNASHRILEKLGFRHRETLAPAQDGTILEWVRSGAAADPVS